MTARRVEVFAAEVAIVLLTAVLGAVPAAAQEQIYFTAVSDAKSVIVQKINNEKVRVDVATWMLIEGDITQALINKFKSGVPVRVIGDRITVFEQTDFNTRNSFLQLANAGVPIRIRNYPMDYPEVMHWKCGIFVGQNTVEFGSANWTTFELMPWTSTNFKDETAFFTNDSALVQAFLTKFDQMWADTTSFLDWPQAYKINLGQDWTTPMTINRARLEPDYPTNPPGMGWGQGPELLNPMITEINAESTGIDVVSYRTTAPSLTDALVQRFKAGVPVRLFIEPTQYRNPGFPEFWLVGAETDKAWAAGISIKQRTHDGLTHMKTLITSRVALVASSNFTAHWQRDHNYFISASAKPSLHQAFKDRFNAMWNDTTNYTTFQPLPPDPPNLVSPGGETNVPNVTTTPVLQWKRAAWAVAFDVYLGTSPSNIPFAGRVDAQLTDDPPQTYTWAVTQPLQPSTTYWWKVVSRTFATDLKPTAIASSTIWSFTTVASGGGGGGGGTPGPFGGTPVSLPGTIQAENFDEGGSGVSYFDTTAGNSGGQYRTTDVDIETTSDAGGGYNVGWVRPSEWLKYTVNVTAAGTYNIDVRVAASSSGGTFHIEVNGADKTGPLTMPNTGGFQAWTTITKTGVSLSAGQQTWRLVIDSLGAGGSVGNINWIRLATEGGGGGGGTGPTPFGGTAVALPGTIEAENFDEGGSGVAYQDLSPGNFGGAYRTTDVDIASATDTGGGYRLGWTDAGEWLKYTVNVGTAGTYDIEARVASGGAGGTFHIEVNGADKTGAISVPNTGGWQTWTTVRRANVTLSAGVQVWRVVMDTLGGTGAVGNINWFRLTAPGGTGGATVKSTPFSGTPITLPGTIEAENFDAGGQDVAYNDLTAGNTGGAYRTTDVDVGNATDTGGGYRLGWIDAGEWLNYTVNVTTAGTYVVQVRVASNGAGGTFHIEVNDVDKTGPMTIPNTGGWQKWTTIQKTGVSLSAGSQVWRVVMDSVGPTGAVGNINWIRVSP